MLEGAIARGFGAGGLDAWLSLGVDPATDSGRDMRVGGYTLQNWLERTHVLLSSVVRCWSSHALASEESQSTRT